MSKQEHLSDMERLEDIMREAMTLINANSKDEWLDKDDTEDMIHFLKMAVKSFERRDKNNRLV
jgi:hypothetical protein